MKNTNVAYKYIKEKLTFFEITKVLKKLCTYTF